MGTDVLVAPYRHPLLVAAMTGTLGRLAGDRLILGVGIGYLSGEFDVLGAAPYERRATSPMTSSGPSARRRRATRWYRLRSRYLSGSAATPLPPCAAPHILGDGWHPLWMSDGMYAEARRRILKLRTAAGLTGPFTFSYSCGATRLVTRAVKRRGPHLRPSGAE